MDIIEELFRKSPFLYNVNDSYYILGSGICVESYDQILEYNFRNFDKAWSTDAENRIAYFKMVKTRCQSYRSMYGFDKDADIRFGKIGFGESEVASIAKQLSRYKKAFRFAHN